MALTGSGTIIDRLFVQIRADSKGLDSDLSGMLGKFGAFATSASGLAAGVGLAVAAIGAAAFSAAKEFDAANKIIIAGTGATGAALADLKESFSDVFGTLPDDAKLVAAALTELNTLTGATGDTLEGLTKQVLDASRALGEDGAANAKLFGRALNAFGIEAKKGGKQMDFLFKLTQDFGVGLGTLTKATSEYGVVLKNAGFSMAESAELFARLEASGIAVSRIMPGLNAAFRKMAKAGIAPKQALLDIVQAMKEAESETKALTIATEAFGAEGAQRMTTAVRNGTLALEDLAKGLDAAAGSIDDTNQRTKSLADRFGELGNKISIALEPLGTVLLDVFKKSLDGVLAVVDKVTPAFQRFGDIIAFVTGNKSDLDKAFARIDEVEAYRAEAGRLEEKLSELGEEAKRQADETLPQYVARLREAAGEMGKFSAKVEDAVGFMQQFTDKWISFTIAVEGVGDVFVKGAESIEDLREQMKEAIKGLPSFAQLLAAAGDKANKLAGDAERGRAALLAMAGATKAAKDAITDFAKTDAFKLLRDDINQIVVELEAMRDAAEAATPALADIGAKSAPQIALMSQAFQDATASVLKLTSKIPNIAAEMNKLEPGRRLLQQITEELERGKLQALAFADAERILATNADFANLPLQERIAILEKLKEKQDASTESTKESGDALSQVSTIATDFSKRLSDVVLGVTEMGDALKALGEVIIRTIVEGAFKSLILSMTQQDVALKKLTSTWKSFLGLFGGGGKGGKAAGDVVTGGGGDVSFGGGLGGAGGVASIISAISDVISNFQFRRMNKLLDLIERNTRDTTRALTGAPELLAQSAQMIGQAAGEISDATQKGFAIASSTRGFDDPSTFVPTNTTPTVPDPAPGLPLGPPGPEGGAGGVSGPQQGLGVLQVLFEHSDFLQDSLGQLKFQTDSLDTLKDLGSRSEGLLTSIRDSLVGIGTVNTVGPVAAALLADIKKALVGSAEGADLLTGIRSTINAVRQHFVYDRDIVSPQREAQRSLLEKIWKELILLNLKPVAASQAISISEFTQAQFRNQLNLGEAIP